MRLSRITSILFATLFQLFFVAVPAFSKQSSIVDDWEGTLEFGGAKLRFIIHVRQTKDGMLTAKADSPDQEAKDLPVDTISFKDGALNFEMKGLQVSYEGKWDADKNEIAGTFKQGAASLPLIFKKATKPIVVNRPQEPKKPYPYDEEEVAYENKTDKVKLAGTLTLPRGKGPFAAVVLITGSGSQDRNEELAGHKPFLVISDYLTRQGIVVLRVDDRGVGKSTGNTDDSTAQDFAEDALLGIEFLKNRKEIDSKKIGLIGHSEGGIVAALAASQSSDVAFIVMMAGPGINGEETVYLQSAALSKAAGANPASIARNREGQEKLFKAIMQNKENDIVKKIIMEGFTEELAALPEAVKKQEQEKLLRKLTTVWFRYFLTCDPQPILKKVKCPVLALNGENDLQVLHKENLSKIESALKAGGNKDFTIQSLPKLNHLFQTSTTGLPTEYGTIEETVAPDMLKILGDWIMKRTNQQK